MTDLEQELRQVAKLKADAPEQTLEWRAAEEIRLLRGLVPHSGPMPVNAANIAWIRKQAYDLFIAGRQAESAHLTQIADTLAALRPPPPEGGQSGPH